MYSDIMSDNFIQNTNEDDKELKTGMVAIIGRPSAGKSTFLNTACQEEVSIVSPIPQTTRNAIKGIVNTTALNTFTEPVKTISSSTLCSNSFIIAEITSEK